MFASASRSRVTDRSDARRRKRVSAAEATTTLRVGTNVLNNDFRHPVLVAREAATIDRPIGVRLLRSGAIAQRDIAEAREARGESSHRCAGIEMRFGRKEQGFFEAPRKIGFERRDPSCLDVFISARTAGKADELGPVPRGGDDERPLAHRDGHAFSPELERFEAEIEDEFFRILDLAPGRQHAAREVRTDDFLEGNIA